MTLREPTLNSAVTVSPGPRLEGKKERGNAPRGADLNLGGNRHPGNEPCSLWKLAQLSAGQRDMGAMEDAGKAPSRHWDGAPGAPSRHHTLADRPQPTGQQAMLLIRERVNLDHDLVADSGVADIG